MYSAFDFTAAIPLEAQLVEIALPHGTGLHLGSREIVVGCFSWYSLLQCMDMLSPMQSAL